MHSKLQNSNFSIFQVRVSHHWLDSHYSHFLKHILLEYVEITGRMQTLQKAARTYRRNSIAQLLYETKSSFVLLTAEVWLSPEFSTTTIVSLFKKRQGGIASLHYLQGILCQCLVFQSHLGHQGLNQQIRLEQYESCALLKYLGAKQDTLEHVK